jgi:hypothetical protein
MFVCLYELPESEGWRRTWPIGGTAEPSPEKKIDSEIAYMFLVFETFFA